MVLGIEKETSQRTVLEYGRVCFQIDSYCFINLEINIHIFCQVRSIMVREETDGQGMSS